MLALATAQYMLSSTVWIPFPTTIFQCLAVCSNAYYVLAVHIIAVLAMLHVVMSPFMSALRTVLTNTCAFKFRGDPSKLVVGEWLPTAV